MSKLMVSTIPVCAALAGAERSGVARDDILASVGIAREDLERIGAKIPGTTEEKIWTALLSEAEMTVGVRAAQATPRGALGAVEYAVRTAPSFARGLEVIVEHTAAWYDAELFRLSASSDGVHLAYRSPHRSERRMSAVAAEYLLASLVRIFQDVTSSPHILRRASVRHGNDRSTPHLVGAFGVPVEIRARKDQLVFAREALTLTPREADAPLHAILLGHLDALAADRPRRNDVVEATCQVIEDHLATDAGVDRVARSLGVSARALQQRLRAQGVTYRQLLEQVRVAVAKRYLRETDAALAAIAETVGFSDLSSFHRSFKRATGQTPAGYRQECAAEEERTSPPPSPRDVA
jgi:AraC-like DNA-binding protein